jgi:hypothetical protein
MEESVQGRSIYAAKVMKWGAIVATELRTVRRLVPEDDSDLAFGEQLEQQ